MKESTKGMGKRWIWRYQTNKQKMKHQLIDRLQRVIFLTFFPAKKKKSEPLTAELLGLPSSHMLSAPSQPTPPCLAVKYLHNGIFTLDHRHVVISVRKYNRRTVSGERKILFNAQAFLDLK